MKCERIAEILPDYLQGSLKHEQDDAVEEHLEACDQCRAEVAVWRELALLPQEQPSSELRVRFHAMLEAYQQGRRERADVWARGEPVTPGWRPLHWFRLPIGGLAFSLLFLVLGFFAGRSMMRPEPPSPQMTAMQLELANMKQLVALTMLQQQSANGRLQGVTWSTREQLADPKVLAALLHTLRHDPSVDVRLAALDALARHGGQPQIRTALLDALDTQQSPLVQVALIDQMVEMRDRSALQRLQRFEQEPGLNPAVQQRAAWAIGKLN